MSSATARFTSQPAGAWQLDLAGELDINSIGVIWTQVQDFLADKQPAKLLVNAERLRECDGAGITLLVQLKRRLNKEGQLEFKRLDPQIASLVDQHDPEKFTEICAMVHRPCRPLAEDVGRQAVDLKNGLHQQISFIGEMTVALWRVVRHPSQVRWHETMLTAERAGVNALPIVTMIGFLIGLVMAFQAVIPMKQFGADVFVASLVGLAMLRELGPLMTAIVLAGRSGAAFTAEIGTMKVNEEVNALVTMGLDPVTFLAVPRLIAATLMMPILTLFANFAGLLGGLLVFRGQGYPLATYISQIQQFVDLSDFLFGMAKAGVFGLLVAGTAVYCGLNTKSGAGAVGESTTKCVVASIVLIAITDGLFSVLAFALNI